MSRLQYEVRVRAQSLVRRLGYDVHRWDGLGINPFADIAKIGSADNNPLLILDVGANVGQTVRRVRDFCKDPVIHCFEPGREPFAELERRYGSDPRIHLNNVAVGSREERRTLFEHESSTMSSFLRLGSSGWGSVKGNSEVEITTLDSYCASRGIDRVDVLKSDTEGFELEVLAGAEKLLSDGRVQFVVLEINFMPIYANPPSFCDVHHEMERHGFEIVSIYGMKHRNDRLSSADVLYARDGG